METTLRQLEVYVEIARRGNLTRAAEALGMSQSGASMALAELERILGEPLFRRIGRRLVPNERGRRLEGPAAAVLEAAARFAEEAQGDREPAGILNLACSTTIGVYVLPERIAAFHRRHPRVDLRLWVGNTKDAAARVRDGEADLGAVEGTPEGSGLQEIPWLQDELAVVAPSDHPLSRVGALDRGTLAEQRWILRERGSGTRSTLEETLSREGIVLDGAMEIGHTEAIKGLVAAGLGLGWISRRAAEPEIARGTLTVLRTPFPVLRRFRLLRRRGEVPGCLAGLAERELFAEAGPRGSTLPGQTTSGGPKAPALKE